MTSNDITKEFALDGTSAEGIDWGIRPIDARRVSIDAPKGSRIYNGYARIPSDSPLLHLVEEGLVEDVIDEVTSPTSATTAGSASTPATSATYGPCPTNISPPKPRRYAKPARSRTCGTSTGSSAKR